MLEEPTNLLGAIEVKAIVGSRVTILLVIMVILFETGI